MARWFYIPDLPDVPAGETVEVALGRDQAHHATRVHRLQAGDEIELFDGAGRIASGELVADDRVAIASVRQEPPVTPVVEIASAVPKGSALKGMIDQLSQAGAASWRPLRTERSVVDPRPGKIERLEAVALAAAGQCGRAHLMTIEPVTDFADCLALDDGAEGLIACLSGGGPAADLPAGVKVRVLIGPEGGWTDDEREAAEAAGYQPIGLGPHVMRIETAAVAGALAVLR
ncbi:MAG: RsmE family RNA methyltransferase [Phycisphaeraceae bacterium]|nr:RsmE family RNA methyltransferase [Phycisphaeraceae bacterium]